MDYGPPCFTRLARSVQLFVKLATTFHVGSHGLAARRWNESSAGGGARYRGSGGTMHCTCSCQCLWAAALATCFLLYASEQLQSSCLNANIGNTQIEGLPHLREELTQPRQRRAQDLLQLETAWNQLKFGRPSPSVTLRIAVFVRKWPSGGVPGGLERHAFTVHQILAERGHDVQVFTVVPGETSETSLRQGNLCIRSIPAANGVYDHARAWAEFLKLNGSKPFDIIHSESVAIHHSNAQGIANLVASWHGIAFEVIHSDIVSDLARSMQESRSPELQKTLSERLFKVTDEIRFFSNYRHHVAISDYVGDVLRTIYELPRANVHVILNGVNSSEFRPSRERGLAFRRSIEVPEDAKLVMGAAGRLVKDKGHPLLVEAMSEILKEGSNKGVYLLVAGDGPWASRYADLSANVKVLGAMIPSQMADFYNAIDIFVNPTLRAQGLDLTLLEAMLCAKPLLATHFSSITRTVVVHDGIGYTFHPNLPSLTAALRLAIADGHQVLATKGKAALAHASHLFTAKGMALAYERLFLCIKERRFCEHPLPFD